MESGNGGKLKVLHLSKTSVGAPWAIRQTREFVNHGVEVHIGLPPGGPSVAQYEANGVIVHLLETDFPIRAPWRAPAIFRGVRELVERVQPDIIHGLHVGATLTMRLALGKEHPIPRVFQVPSPLHLEHALYGRCEIATAGPRDYWIGTCHAVANRYRALGVADERLFVSNYGVDLEAHVNHPKGKLRRELGVDEHVRLVGMAGFMYAPKRLFGQRRGLKGHEDLIDALAICLKTDPDLLGVFIGGAWGGATEYEERVRAYGKQHCGDRLVFLGTRDDVLELLPDLDLAVQPSHTESVASTMIEAQLLDVPVVATNVGGLPDLIVHGETGWLVPPRDPARMAEAILMALDDPARTRTMREKGRARAMALYDCRKNNADVLTMYRTILARSMRSADVPELRQTAV